MWLTALVKESGSIWNVLHDTTLNIYNIYVNMECNLYIYIYIRNYFLIVNNTFKIIEM